jgi:peptidoglycan hydrolase-like protein with peptidoglycan-binding domain
LINSFRLRAVVLGIPVALLAASACTSSSAASNTPSASSTVPSGSLPETTTAPAAPAVTDPPATDPGTTIGTTTTVDPSSTTSTTIADTTTAAPTTTLPSNVEVVGPTLMPLAAVGGKSGPDTAAIQNRLIQLGFWVGNHTGSYDFSTVQAVMAFQKYAHLPATGKVDTGTAAYLSAFDQKAHGNSDSGDLVEVDKGRQLLFIVLGGKTAWAFNTSTGSGIPYQAPSKKDPTVIEKGDAVTPDGLWKVNRMRPDGWWDGDLGKIYRPKYFHGGIAIHGMTSVPNHPASHGCVRVSTQAMDFIWGFGLIPLGTPVWVHE